MNVVSELTSRALGRLCCFGCHPEGRQPREWSPHSTALKTDEKEPTPWGYHQLLQEGLRSEATVPSGYRAFPVKPRSCPSACLIIGISVIFKTERTLGTLFVQGGGECHASLLRGFQNSPLLQAAAQLKQDYNDSKLIYSFTNYALTSRKEKGGYSDQGYGLEDTESGVEGTAMRTGGRLARLRLQCT
ncbi:hypothetical protein U0070_015345, partial [Myodes glareolus]